MRDGMGQSREAGTSLGGGTTLALILIYDDHRLARPAQGHRSLHQRVLAFTGFGVLEHLCGA